MRWSRTTYPEATVLQTADAAAHLITSLVRMVGFEPTRLLKTTGSQPMLSTKFSTSAFASSPTTHAASLFNHIAVEYPLSAYVMGLPIVTGLPVCMCDVSLLTIEVVGATQLSRLSGLPDLQSLYVSSLSVWTSMVGDGGVEPLSQRQRIYSPRMLPRIYSPPWCLKGDSNPHAFQHSFLRRTCLPNSII